jgi:hypothetical protein
LKLTAAGRLPFADGSALTVTPADVEGRLAAAVRESAPPDIVVLHATPHAIAQHGGAVIASQLLSAGSALVAGGRCTRFAVSMDAWDSPAAVEVASAVSSHPACLGASFLGSLAQQDCLRPRTELGGRSVAALFHSAGLLNFVRAPLDAVVNGVPFRCIETPEHRDHHPTRVTALLNDVINFAIHCEVLWERSVRATVLEDWALAAKTKTARTGTGSGRRSDAATSNVDAHPASWSALATEDGGGGDDTPLPAGPVPELHDTDVAWARIVAQQLQRRPDLPFTLLEWEYAKNRRMRPAMSRLLHAVRGSDGAREWASAYKAFMSELSGKVDIFVEQAHSFAAQHAAREVARIVGKPVAPPPALHATVASLLLASVPGAILVSEVPELFGLRPRSAGRAAAAAAAHPVAASAPPSETETAPAPPAQPSAAPALDWQTAGPALRAAMEAALATKPPSWEDPLAGVPTQAELAPLQAAARRMQAPAAPPGRS